MNYQYINRFSATLAGFFILLLIIAGCSSNNSTNPVNTGSSTAQVVNLVSDSTGYGGVSRADINLQDAWGMTLDPSGNYVIASRGKGLILMYDRNGNALGQQITVATPTGVSGGMPTGLVYNTTSDFFIQATGEKATYIFVTENGTINAWASGTYARVVVDRTAYQADYRGVAIATDSSANYVYAANYAARRIDVFDRNFALVTNKSFDDPSMPADFAPYNIANIGGLLYVTYAPTASQTQPSGSSPGSGYVDVFNPNGTLARRFAGQGNLNYPWGITRAPAGFGVYANSILIGNLGDGKINAYDTNGNFIRSLSDSTGNAVSIPGLWSLAFQPNSAYGDVNTLWFTAGPGNGAHGLFGYIKLR